MNGGFADHGLDEDAFGENKAVAAVKAFDAFPKTKPSYQQQTPGGGVWTLCLIAASFLLAVSELRRWHVGTTTHTFSVEKGISHDLQINLDVVVQMKCEDLHINVQDAAGDRILAAQMLEKAPTMWDQWSYNKAAHILGESRKDRENVQGAKKQYSEDDVHDYLGASRKRKFAKTPRVPRKSLPDSCRVFGSLEGNKVQGDFHITARGHGYMEFGQHLDHNAFNFSHQINELSFGPFYPSLENPLDNTLATTDLHFWKYQYYLSVVPTIYTTDARAVDNIDPSSPPPSSDDESANKKSSLFGWNSNTVFTNQYAVTEQSRAVPEHAIPGIFVKYDIEPILLTIAEEWDSFLSLAVRLVNVISGILVAGGWMFQISEWARETYGRRRRRAGSDMGMLHGKSYSEKN